MKKFPADKKEIIAKCLSMHVHFGGLIWIPFKQQQQQQKSGCVVLAFTEVIRSRGLWPDH